MAIVVHENIIIERRPIEEEVVKEDGFMTW